MAIPESTPGLLYAFLLEIGMDELGWMQAEQHRRRQALRKGLMSAHGLVVRRAPGGDLLDQWLVTEGGGAHLTVLAGPASAYEPLPEPAVAIAVDVDGVVTELAEDATNVLTVPNDGVWRTVVVERDVTTYEQGTLAVVGGSKNVVGTDTRFTEYSGKTTSAVPRGSRVFIKASDSANGNQGTYEIDTITDDTHLALVAVVNGTTESSLKFGIAGAFKVSPPADPRIHEFRKAKFTLVARTRNATAPGLVLADVVRSAGVTTIIDRRETNLYRAVRPRARGIWMRPGLTFDGATPYTAAALDRTMQVMGIGASNVTWPTAAPSADNKLLAAVLNATNGHLVASEYDPATTTVFGPAPLYWNNPGGAGLITIDGSGTATEPSIVQLPATSGNTHACFFHDTATKTIGVRFSTDNGATWGGATTILTPTNANASNDVERPAAILLRNGRLAVAVGYFDKTLHGGAGLWAIYYVFSDDYGVTWDNNGDQGWPSAVINQPIGLQYYDQRRPSIAQGADGLVWFAYEVSNAGTNGDKVYVQPAALDSLDTSFVVIPLGFIGYPLQTLGDKMLGPAIWCGEDGAVCVLTTRWVLNVALDVWLHTVASKQNGAGAVVPELGDSGQLFRIEASGALAQEDLHLCVAQNRGRVHLLVKDSAAADTVVIDVPLTPETIELGRTRLE